MLRYVKIPNELIIHLDDELHKLTNKHPQFKALENIENMADDEVRGILNTKFGKIYEVYISPTAEGGKRMGVTCKTLIGSCTYRTSWKRDIQSVDDLIKAVTRVSMAKTNLERFFKGTYTDIDSILADYGELLI